MSQDQIDKLSQINMGRKHSEATKEKMKLAHQKENYSNSGYFKKKIA